MELLHAVISRDDERLTELAGEKEGEELCREVQGFHELKWCSAAEANYAIKKICDLKRKMHVSETVAAEIARRDRPSYSFSQVRVPGDGNCMFHAILESMYHAEARRRISGDFLRSTLARWAREHGGGASALHRLETGEWGQDEELQIAACALGRKIFVRQTVDQDAPSWQYFEPRMARNRSPLYIINHGNHFDALIPSDQIAQT